VSDPFGEVPPLERDPALPMVPSYYVDTIDDGLAYVKGYADTVLA
jgi:hypothetical protein